MEQQPDTSRRGSLTSYLRSLLGTQLRGALEMHETSGEPPAENRRSAGRLRTDFLRSNFGPVLDLSRSGAKVGLLLRRPPATGQKLMLVLKAGEVTERVQAEIVRVQTIKKGYHEIGLRFENLDDVQARRLGEIAQVANSRFAMKHLDDAA